MNGAREREMRARWIFFARRPNDDAHGVEAELREPSPVHQLLCLIVDYMQ